MAHKHDIGTYQLLVEGHDDALLVCEVGDTVGESDDEAWIHLTPDDVTDGNWNVKKIQIYKMNKTVTLTTIENGSQRTLCKGKYHCMADLLFINLIKKKIKSAARMV